MKVIWTPQAWKGLQQTARRIRSEYGLSARVKVMQNMLDTAALLQKHPHLGPVEPLLAHRTRLYRSIVATPLNKLIYYVGDDTIEIAAVWDTRRDPAALAAEVK